MTLHPRARSDLQPAMGILDNLMGAIGGGGGDPQVAAGHLAQLLPQVVDHLTPNGQIPSGALGALGGLLDKFKG